MLAFQKRKCLDRHLIDLARQTTDAGVFRQTSETANAILLTQEPNKHRLHFALLNDIIRRRA
jgi:hypothetical protein